MPTTVRRIDCQTAHDTRREINSHIFKVYDMLSDYHAPLGYQTQVYFNLADVLFLKRLGWLHATFFVR